MSQTEQTTAVQEEMPRNIPVTRIRVDGNSVLPLLRAFAGKGYANNIYSLSEAAKLHEVFQFLDNLASQSAETSESKDASNASVDEATKDMEDTVTEVAEVASAVDAVANAVEEAVNKKLSSE